LATMAKDNVELVRRSFEAFGRGDFETAFAAHHPDTEWCTAADEPDSQTYHGIAGLRRLVASVADPWEDRFEEVMGFKGFIAHGDWVIVPWTARLRGKGSGIAIEVSETYAVRVQEGKIVRVEEYRSTEQALEAVGRGE
jgi:uncharacterized protein